MKVAYFDCFSGASGDMILGAMFDAGLPVERLRQELDKLGLGHYTIDAAQVVKRGLGGCQALVEVDEHHHGHHHRHFGDVKNIIEGSRLDEAVKKKAVDVFTRLAEAEAKVHRTTVDHIHFHEVGAMDAIIDVVGAAAGLTLLGVEKVYCSALHVGSGTIECAHGTLPVPAPATTELILGKPVYSTGVAGELLTPTGAAILTTLASGFGAMPAMTVETVGYGAGTSDPAIPNLLRLVLGRAGEGVEDFDLERVAVIETNIDDMNPQIYDYLFQTLLGQGALDVGLTPMQMKKNRPGTLLTVVCPLEEVARLSALIIRETTTIGLRWRIDNRIKARRELVEVETRFGPIKVKVADTGNGSRNVTPEYEDCKRIALEGNLPLKTVMEEARAAAAKL